MAVNLNSAALNAFRDLANRNASNNVDENTILQKDGDGFKSGGVWSKANIFRSIRLSSTKEANNEIRAALLESLGRAFNLEGMGQRDGKCTFSPAFMRALTDKLGAEIFKDGDFGMKDDCVCSGQPLTQRRIAAIIQQADVVIQREAEEARANGVELNHVQNDGRVLDGDGFTVVDREGVNVPPPTNLNEGEEVEADELERRNVDFNEKADREIEQGNAEPENGVQNQEDLEGAQQAQKTKDAQAAHDKLVAELKEKIAIARKDRREQCMALCDVLVRKTAGDVRNGKYGATGLKQTILAETLEKHAKGFYEADVDEALRYTYYDDEGAMADEIEAFTGARPEDDDPPDVKALKKELDFLECERTDEDFENGIAKRVGDLADAVDDALASRAKGNFVGDDAFCEMMNKRGVGYADNLRMTPVRMMHNAQVRENVENACGKLRIRVDDFIAQNANIGVETPDFADRMHAKLEEKLEAFRQEVAGELDGMEFDGQDINRRFSIFEDEVSDDLAAGKEAADARAGVRALLEANVTTFVQTKNVLLAPRLNPEDMERLNGMLVHPSDELKQELEKAIVAHLANNLDRAGNYFKAFSTAFNKLADELVTRRESEGVKLRQAMVEGFAKTAPLYFEEGREDTLTSLGNISVYTDAKKDLNAAANFGKLRDAAIQQAVNKTKVGRAQTPAELERNRLDLENAFRDEVRNATFRVELTRRAIDRLLARDEFKARAFTLCKQKGMATNFFGTKLTDESQKKLDGVLLEVRQVMYMKAVTDGTMSLKEMSEGTLVGRFQDKFLEVLSDVL